MKKKITKREEKGIDENDNFVSSESPPENCMAVSKQSEEVIGAVRCEKHNFYHQDFCPECKSEKEVSIWFKIWIRIKYNVLFPFKCFCLGHEEYNGYGMSFCRKCIKKLKSKKGR